MMPPRLGTWRLLRSQPGAYESPAALPPSSADWLAATVPGTVGAALQAAGRWQPDDAFDFDAADWWYCTVLEGEGEALLRFDGLATIAEVFLDGVAVLAGDNMFLSHELVVALSGRHDFAIAFRSLDAHLAGRKSRARWRPRLVRPPSLRLVRTLLLGHVPGWGPPVQAVGPWRGVSVVAADALRIVERSLDARFDRDGEGLLDVVVRLSRPVEGWVTARCGDIDFVLIDEGDGRLRGRVEIPDVRRWWPHTHGEPALYPVDVTAGGQSFALGAIGFRTVAIDRGADGQGFGLLVNGVPVFCRGACWTTPDIVALPFSREAHEPLLRLAREGGMNMIRVGGTMGYQGDAFHALCDELGLMVWQDFAFANFDYPANDENFRASVDTEARQFLARTVGSPSLCVLCGASEVAQQASMLGMPPPLWSNALFDEVLPAACAALRSDVPYTPHSPWGGAMPFQADVGISHYYGVSAHRRPIEEARRAHVRFSAESLGLANVPDVAAFAIEPEAPAIVHPAFTERHAHDVGASWAFEAIRNHYTEALYRIDVAALRRDDPERFLAYARATSAEVMEATFAEWRREGSVTRGALVWFLRDLFPGAGWGVIDATGAPKAAYYGLKRAFRPCGLVLTDENLNGLKVSLYNEAATKRSVKLTLACLREGETPVMRAEADFVLAPRSTIGLAATTLWGGFFDTTYAFRFGEPSHDVTVARLTDATTDQVLADAFHFPLGRGHERRNVELDAVARRDLSGWQLTLQTRRLAQSVRLTCPDTTFSDNYFHLAPGFPRTILGPPAFIPELCTIEALNGTGFSKTVIED